MNNLAPALPPFLRDVPAPQWLTVAQAAQLMAVSERHIRRLCGSEWLAQAKARTVDGEWQIRSDAAPEFSLVSGAGAFTGRSSKAPIAALSTEDLRNIPRKMLDGANDRLRILKEWERYVSAADTLGLTKDQATDRFIAGLAASGHAAPSRPSLYGWAAKFKREGLPGLLDGRSGRSNARKLDRTADPFLQEAKRLYQHQNGRSVQFCYDHALIKAEELGWQIQSYSVTRRFIESLDPRETILYREGPEAFMNKVVPNIDRDYSELASNEIWNADHHRCDVMVQIGEKLNKSTGELEPQFARPWLTAWQDIRSRKIVGWLIRIADPNTEAILEAMHRACKSHGIPEHAYTDLGKDFDSQALGGETKKQRRARLKLHIDHDQKRLGGIYAALGCQHLRAWPYHGQSKPIERFFGTMEGGFGKMFDTYCGRSTDEKPEQLPQQLAAGHAPTLDEFIATFEQWLELGYHQKVHTGDSMDARPAEVWAQCLSSKKTVSDELLEVLFQPLVGPFKIGQNGFTHQQTGYGKRETSHLFGQEVYARIDRDDIRQVSLWTPDGKLLCIAQANERVGFKASQQDKRRAIQEKLSDTRAIKASFAPRLRIHESLSDRLLRQKVEATSAESAGNDPNPPSFKPVRNTLEGQLPMLQKMKKAVGDGTPHQGMPDQFDLVSATDDLDLSSSRRTSPAVPSLLQLVGDAE